MKIGIIGAGKVGCSIGKYLTEHGFSVAGYCSKSKKRGRGRDFYKYKSI